MSRLLLVSCLLAQSMTAEARSFCIKRGCRCPGSGVHGRIGAELCMFATARCGCRLELLVVFRLFLIELRPEITNQEYYMSGLILFLQCCQMKVWVKSLHFTWSSGFQTAAVSADINQYFGSHSSVASLQEQPS